MIPLSFLLLLSLPFFSFFVQIFSSVVVRNVYADTAAIFKPDIMLCVMCVL